MPFGASKAAILGASGGGDSYDPAYTWIEDIKTSNSTTQEIAFTSLPSTYHALHVIGNYGFTAGHYIEVRLTTDVTNHMASGYELGGLGSGGPYGANSMQSTRIFLGGYTSSTSLQNDPGGSFLEMIFPGYTNTDEPAGGYANASYPSTAGWSYNLGFEGVIRSDSPNTSGTATAGFDEIRVRVSSGYFYEDSKFSLYGIGTATDG
tara:strand:- start:52 stop:669 length:618 start_codon:yes stop_codon:yes gene_type:complete